jgi:hypothetical protein
MKMMFEFIELQAMKMGRKELMDKQVNEAFLGSSYA